MRRACRSKARWLRSAEFESVARPRRGNADWLRIAEENSEKAKGCADGGWCTYEERNPVHSVTDSFDLFAAGLARCASASGGSASAAS